MPVTPTYPGVYVQEIPSGTHTITGVATSITGFVGYLRRGPVNVAVQCLNFGDFQRVFGGLDDLSETSFQVSQFFLNGGSEAWVSRLVASASPPVLPVAPVTCGPLGKGGGLAPPGGPALLNLAAANPGTWGESILVSVDFQSVLAGSMTFNLTATLYAWTSAGASVQQVQSLPGLTLDASRTNSAYAALSPVGSGGLPAAGAAALVVSTDTLPPVGPGYTPPAVLPVPTGTLLAFAAPSPPAHNVTVTVTVQPPTPPATGSTKPQAPPAVTGSVTVASVGSVADIVGAIQSALAVVGAQNGLPTLGSAQVRTCANPFPPAPETPTVLIQVSAGDPNLAGYLVGVTAATGGLTPLSTNIQALALVPPPAKKSSGPAGAPPPPPDGAVPSGFDVAGNAVSRTGIYALEGMSLVNLICVPDLRLMGAGDYLVSAAATLNYALQRRAFGILDLPQAVTTPSLAIQWVTGTPGDFGPGIISAASYFPQPMVPSPFSSQPRVVGACGTIAGLYALTDATRGVWKAPAGITAALTGVQQLQYVMTDQENGLLNPLGMNALRTFPIYDNISWGARTLASPNVAYDDWKYVPVRRLTLYIEQSLIQGLQWAVFEPNDETLWAQIRLSVTGFMQPLFQQGAFVGQSPAQAYQVICDASTTTAQDMDNGVVNLKILFAPVRPAEFVVISIQQMAGQSAGS